MEYISASIDSVQVERKLRMLPPVTYAAVCFSDQATGVEAAKSCGGILLQVPERRKKRQNFQKNSIAVRMQSNGSVLRFLMQQEERGGAGRGDLVDFGSGKADSESKGGNWKPTGGRSKGF